MRSFNIMFTALLFTVLMSGLTMAQDTTLTITNYGYVGIGATQPSSKLQVVGSLGAGDIGRFSNHMLSTRVAGDNAVIDVAIFGSNEGTTGFEVGVFGRNLSPEGFGVFSQGNFKTTGNATFEGDVLITNSSGYFGIHPYFNNFFGTTLLGSFIGTELYPQLRFANSVNEQEFIDIGQNANGDFVVEGTDTERLVISRTTGDATFSGNVAVRGVNTGAGAVKIVRGVVSPTGTILSGSGFTVTHDALGLYTVTFTESFSGYPSVSGSTIDYAIFSINSLSSGPTVQIAIQSPSDASYYDTNFTFIAIGASGDTPSKNTTVISAQRLN